MNTSTISKQLHYTYIHLPNCLQNAIITKMNSHLLFIREWLFIFGLINLDLSHILSHLHPGHQPHY